MPHTPYTIPHTPHTTPHTPHPNLFVSVEQTETHEGQHLLSDPVARSRQMWQHLHHRRHVVQLYLDVVYQRHLSAGGEGVTK